MENQLLNEKRKSFGLYEAALATLLFIVFNMGFMFLFRAIPSSVRQSGSVVYYIASFVIEALFGVVAYVVAVSRKVDFIKGIGANKKVNGNIIFYSVLISFVCLIFFGNLTNVFIAFLEICGYSSILGSLEIPNFGIYLVYVLTACIAPAVCEEFLFRGVIASGLKEKGFKVALFASAVIFTLMHGNPEQTVHQFIIGYVIGYAFLKTGNIWIGVIVHFVNNFTAVTMTYISSFSAGEEVAAEVAAAEPVTAGSFIVSVIIAAVMAMIGYIIIKKLVGLILIEHNRVNNVSNENATIKVDDAEVNVEMMVDEMLVELDEKAETEKTESVEENAQNKENEKVPLSVTLMFVISGAYFLIEWLSSLLTGLGMF